MRRLFITRFLRLCFFAALLISPPWHWASQNSATAWAQPETPPAGRNTPFCVVGYLPTYELKTFELSQAQYLTDIILFSATPTAAGELDVHEISPAALESMKKIQAQYGTRVLLALGGWNRCQSFAPMAQDPEKRRSFIAALRTYLLQHKLAGADLDWEYPRGNSERAAYASLLVEMQAAFRPEKLLVTVALSPAQELPSEAFAAVNRVHVMSYDRPGAEFSTLALAKRDVQNFLDRKLPREKIVLGLPCYGRNPELRGQALSYAQLVKRFQPPANNDLAQGYYFNGLATVRAKAEFAAAQGIGGIMLWELGQDTTDATSLLRAVRSALPKN